MASEVVLLIMHVIMIIIITESTRDGDVCQLIVGKIYVEEQITKRTNIPLPN